MTRLFDHRFAWLLALCFGALIGSGGGATFAAFSGTAQSGGNTFSAAASFDDCSTPTPFRLTGFEHGTINTNLFQDVQ